MAFKAPGPGAYAPEKKPVPGERSAPSYSMGSRTRYRKSKQLASYYPQCKITSKVASYQPTNIISFFITGDINPSPNTYSLPVLLGPHIPNRTSSACYSLGARQQVGGFDTDYAKTPGPARYGITTPEIYQRKAPSYSMLKRNYMPGGNCISISFSTSFFVCCRGVYWGRDIH